MASQDQNGPHDPADGKPVDARSRARRAAQAIGTALLLLASRLWAGLVGGWRELGRRDAADIASARARARARAADEAADDEHEQRRRSIFLWLPKRRSAVVALVLLLLLLLWRCGHDGVPTGSASTFSGHDTGDGTGTPVCDGLLEHDEWTGRISYKHQRDVTDPDGDYHLAYHYDLDLSAHLVERTRRQNRGKDYLVQVFSPNPDGRIETWQHLENFDGLGLESSYKFSATGGVNKYEEGMAETGSMMSLTVKDDCTYQVFLQAQVLGEGTSYTRHKGTGKYEGMLGIPAIRGEGIADSGSLVSGTFELPVLSEGLLERQRNNPDWDAYHYVIERDKVADVLGEDKLGTVTVSWHFEAVD